MHHRKCSSCTRYIRRDWVWEAGRDTNILPSVTCRLYRAIVVVDLVLRDRDCDRGYGYGRVCESWRVSTRRRRPSPEGA